ncbi:uncharacterized protein [Drosophila kikkawai]|uniref:Uncharacterized protein n=1 Tax=Drosophila kikkawai TaxID=30033 RepID=A0A6P4I5B5_DROKI|nr:uncharacterized protein LOC108075981 [Drosophila kikkawai]
MDDKDLQKHYERVMRDLQKERLLTFEEMLEITKIPPEILKRTIAVLAPGLCCYQKLKAEQEEEEEENFDEHWTVQDMQDIADFEEKRQRVMDKYHKKAKKEVKNMRNKENIIKDKSQHEEFDDNPNFERDQEIVSFEDLVKLTFTHPFYLERCLCHLAILAETEEGKPEENFNDEDENM